MATSILRLPTVKARTGLSRSTIYLRISEGHFPKPISLGGRAVGWIEEEITEWLHQQIEDSLKWSSPPGHLAKVVKPSTEVKHDDRENRFGQYVPL